MPFPFRTVTVVFDGGGVFVLTFVPSAVAFATLATPTSGFTNSLDRVLDRLLRGRQLAVAADLVAVEARLEKVPARQRRGQERVLEHGPARVVAAHLDVLRDRRDDLRQVERVEAVRHLLLERAHELLLAREPVEVRVGVPEADELERRAARDALVAGLEVDVGELVVATRRCSCCSSGGRRPSRRRRTGRRSA